MGDARPIAAGPLFLPDGEAGELREFTTNEWLDVLACVAVAYTRALPLPDVLPVLEDFATRLEEHGRNAAKQHVREFSAALSRKLMAMEH